MIVILYNRFQKIEMEEILSNSFYKDSITLIPKPDKYNTKEENYRPRSLIGMHVKILNKILGKKIQQFIKRILYHDQVEFIPGIQGWFYIKKSVHVIHHIDKLKKKNMYSCQ